MHKFTTSTNIERDVVNDINYVVTPNAKNVFERIVTGFQQGHHSFNIIGSYGTGKSSFLWALEKNLKDKKPYFANLNGQFKGFEKFSFLKIIGEASPLTEVLKKSFKLKENTSNSDLIDTISKRAASLRKKDEILVVLIDEFGKFLEYAAKHNPDSELYFIQQLAELANDSNRNIILITTLHQNFGSYANDLSQNQKNEWDKVKGRLIDISFDEPIEQLLYLASARIEDLKIERPKDIGFEDLFNKINESKLVSNSETLNYDLANKLYPFDILSANILAQTLQKYGQNERSLFSFLANSQVFFDKIDKDSHTFFNVADVFDYLTLHLTSELEDRYSNPHKPQWNTIVKALDKAEAINDFGYENLAKIIKTIGLVNLFAKSFGKLNKNFLEYYGKYALNIPDSENYIEKLISQKIIKFYNYRNKFFFIDGTDVDIEQELIDANSHIDTAINIATKTKHYFKEKYHFAKEAYFEIGTPRFFKVNISDHIENIKPEGEIDGYVHIILSRDVNLKSLKNDTANKLAQLYVVLKKFEFIKSCIYEIEKMDFVLQKYSEDNVVKKILTEEKAYEVQKLQKLLEHGIYEKSNADWFYNGKKLKIDSKVSLNRNLSQIAKKEYSSTPRYLNEMVNKEYLSTPVLTARKNLLKDLLEHSEVENLNYDDRKFPPQKSIYLGLLKETGIHRAQNNTYILTDPTDATFRPLWEHCENFLEDSKHIKKNLSELYESLSKAPFKLKKGLIDFWIPIFLIIKNQDYALFHKASGYVPYLTSEVLDLVHKKPSDYELKSYKIEGVRLNLFNKYKEITGVDASSNKPESSLISIFSSFIAFYNALPEYVKKTNRLSPSAKGLRDAIASAKDPENALLSEIPKGLGYKNINLEENDAQVLNNFIERLNDSINEIRVAYDGLLNRFEECICDSLNLNSNNFNTYKGKIQARYKSLKPHLLIQKEKVFLNRIMSKLDERDSWLKSIADVILGKSIEKMNDEDEALLMDNTRKVFSSLDNLLELHSLADDNVNNEVVQFQLTDVSGKTVKQNIVLSSSDEKHVSKLQKDLTKVLSKNDKLSTAAIIRYLKNLHYES